MKREELRPFFEPSGVAIVGATRSPGFGYVLPIRLREQGWSERVFLVNRSGGGELHGYPVYSVLSEVPDWVDLAVLMVPAPAVPSALEEIGKRGIKYVILESAGFAEVGEEGRALQEKAAGAARAYGLRVIGPNCVGVVNTANRFSSVDVIPQALTPGPLAIIAQSGVFGNVLLDGLYQRGLFISKAVTLGNRMDVNEMELLEYLHADPPTRVIMMYLEGTADGTRLKTTLSRVTPDKPVLVLKSGRTSAGRAATASHTGSLSGEDALYTALFLQTGAVRAESLEELVEFARIFTTQPLPSGKRLGIITSSGSLGALAVDSAVSAGLQLPPLHPMTVTSLRQGAPAWMNVQNPLDVGPSGLYARGLPALLTDPGIDMVLAITIIPFSSFQTFGPFGFTPRHWFGEIAAARELAPEKPLVLCAVGHAEFIQQMREVAGDKVPVLTSPELTARGLGALARYAEWKRRESDEPRPI